MTFGFLEFVACLAAKLLMIIVLLHDGLLHDGFCNRNGGLVDSKLIHQCRYGWVDPCIAHGAHRCVAQRAAFVVHSGERRCQTTVAECMHAFHDRFRNSEKLHANGALQVVCSQHLTGHICMICMVRMQDMVVRSALHESKIMPLAIAIMVFDERTTLRVMCSDYTSVPLEHFWPPYVDRRAYQRECEIQFRGCISD